jgi:hypothetical protein
VRRAQHTRLVAVEAKTYSAAESRCGECGRITGIDTNGRDKPIYRCRTRGKGCTIPDRSTAGLHRAARLGVELLRTDHQLVEAIRTQFAEKTERAGAGTAELFDLFDLLASKIIDDFFAEQERQLTAKIDATEAGRAEAIETHRHNALAEAFELAAAMLRDPASECAEIWDIASAAERRVIVEELIESVTIYADRLELNVHRRTAATRHPRRSRTSGAWYGSCCVGGPNRLCIEWRISPARQCQKGSSS